MCRLNLGELKRLLIEVWRLAGKFIAAYWHVIAIVARGCWWAFDWFTDQIAFILAWFVLGGARLIVTVWLLVIGGIHWICGNLFHCLWRWPTGRDLAGRESGASGIAPLVTLSTVGIAQGVTLLYLNYERAANRFSYVVFVVVAIVLLAGMVGVMRAVNLRNNNYVAAFDLATMRWGSGAYIIVVLTLLSVLVCVASGFAPQKPQAQRVRVVPYHWKFDGSDGEKITFAVLPSDVAFRTSLRMDVVLSKQIANDWAIEHVVGYSDDALKMELGFEGPAEEPGSTPEHYIGKWLLLEPRRYYMVVALHRKTNAKMTGNELDRLLRANPSAVDIVFPDE
jgi:hypothetical protein